jgi:TPR repeat protein
MRRYPLPALQPNGCVNVGRAYRDGLGVPRDEERAATLFREACDRSPDADDVGAAENRSRACSLLGALYLAGDGVKKDDESGRALSELGCERGDAFGCFNAAAVYASGEGVDADPARAAEFLDRACELGDAEGCYDLGIAYEKGNGVAADRGRAVSLFGRACELGFKAACARRSRSGSGRVMRAVEGPRPNLHDSRKSGRTTVSPIQVSDGSPDGDSAGVPSEIPGVA